LGAAANQGRSRRADAINDARKAKRGGDLIFDALPFGRLWYGEPNAISNAIGYAEHYSRSHDAVIRVYDHAAT
jgi:hypothetical protein